ncbi:MAG: xanthine dehydrogenase small subunit [Rhizobiales bacterium]|nr:xanthine dehydrogenase small subunit [Hyphomicrobiales bacterium]
MSERGSIKFRYRGRTVALTDVGPMDTLLDWLRLDRHAMGTKEGCGEGDCGACTVALGSLRDGKVVYEAVNACILLLGMIDGKELICVDDLARDGELHPVQQAMVETHGSQCGFCTPGFVMSLFTLYHRGGAVDRSMVNDQIAGNLCRCTGYRPIADAAIKTCSGTPQDAWIAAADEAAGHLAGLDDGHDVFIGDAASFFAAPASEYALAALYSAHPDATLVGGATDVGLWITKQLRSLPKIIHTGRVKSLHAITEDADTVAIGAAATYAEAEEALGGIDPDIAEMLRRLGSKQVRASGTIGGNIANGSPIGDTPPVLIALKARLQLRHGETVRDIALEDFFIDYGKQDRGAGELATKVTIPKLEGDQVFRCYKISKRFDQDISALLGAFRFTIKGSRIRNARIAFGGMAATPKRALAAESALQGAKLKDRNVWENAAAALDRDFSPIDDMRASSDYRRETAKSLLMKALIEVAGEASSNTRVTGVRGGELESVA